MKLETPLAKSLFSVMRIEVSGANHAGVGTAFVFSQTWKDAHAPFLVTAAHLVENAQKGRIFFTKGKDEKPVVGEYVCLELDEFGKGWHRHPKPEIDLAVLPLAPLVQQMMDKGTVVYNTALDESLLPDDGPESNVDAVEDVLVLGYSAEVQDRMHLLPLSQKGTTANPYGVNHSGQPKFSVQVPIYAGMAGSPVLIARTIYQPTPQGMASATQLMMLGVLTDVATRQERSASTYVPVPLLPAPNRIDSTWFPLGLAVKASAVTEAVNDFLKKLEPAAASK